MPGRIETAMTTATNTAVGSHPCQVMGVHPQPILLGPNRDGQASHPHSQQHAGTVRHQACVESA